MTKITQLAEKYLVFVNVVENDLGPITKIIPTLDFVKNGDKIFIVDDDTVYGRDALKRLYDAKLPAVGFYGRKNLKWRQNTENIPMKMDFLETYGGVLYDASLLFGLKQVDKCVSQDDIVIGKHIRDKGVEVFIINNNGINIHSEGDGTPQLRDENVMGNGNENCYNYLFNDAR